LHPCQPHAAAPGRGWRTGPAGNVAFLGSEYYIFPMKSVTIDTGQCIGCSLCENELPEVFRMGEYTAGVIRDPENDEEREAVVHIARDCPAGAIRINTAVSEDLYEEASQ
jgi:ferredoxin